MQTTKSIAWCASVRTGAACLILLFAFPAARAPALGAESRPKAEPDGDSDPDIAQAVRLERAIQKLAQRLAPCVVSVQVQLGLANLLEELQRQRQPFSHDHGRFGPEHQIEGSGVICESDGYVITNEHVVHGAERIRVKLWDGRILEAAVCGRDPRSDLAMLRLGGERPPADLPCVALADSSKVAVGQTVLAFGNPFGLPNSLTMGVVSAVGRSMPGNSTFLGHLIQTDAMIDPGNSGGPLFDLRGRLIGINTVILSYTGVSTRCGFAIPSNHLQKRLACLKAGREIEYGWLGVQMADFQPGQKEFKVPENKGVLIERVLPDTPADRAGLEQGTVILEFDGARICNTMDLMGAVNDTPVGRTVAIKVVDRAGKEASFNARIAKRNEEVVQASRSNAPGGNAEVTAELDEDAPPDELPQSTSPQAASAGKTGPAAKLFSWRGLQVKELDAEDGRKHGGRLEVVHVKRGSPADHADLYEGAIITELKHGGSPAIEKVNTLEEFKRIATRVNGAASLYILAEGYVTVEEK
ncbi:MAG: trypsin-like peptidase domain-containing protein [Planctomycetota bacterium]